MLVARCRIRREELAELVWPEVANPGSNLRTTLSYLRHVMEPDRRARRTAVLRSCRCVVADAERRIAPPGGFLWELDDRLDEAAEHNGLAPREPRWSVLRSALPLWPGEPFADVVEGQWADVERARVRDKYTAAAVRAGELLDGRRRGTRCSTGGAARD